MSEPPARYEHGPSGDPVVEAIRALLLRRSKRGQQKYGKTLDRNDLTLADWLQHAIEEGLDQVLYLERARQMAELMTDDLK